MNRKTSTVFHSVDTKLQPANSWLQFDLHGRWGEAIKNVPGIRELSPDEFALHVQAEDGEEITTYEWHR